MGRHLEEKDSEILASPPSSSTVLKVCRICRLSNRGGSSPVFSNAELTLSKDHEKRTLFYYRRNPYPTSNKFFTAMLIAIRKWWHWLWCEETSSYADGPTSLPFQVDNSASGNEFIAPCQCKGTIRYVHRSCLNVWRMASSRKDSFYQCEQCFANYKFTCGILARLLSHWITVNALSTMTYIIFLCCVFKMINSSLDFPSTIASNASIHGYHRIRIDPPFSHTARYDIPSYSSPTAMLGADGNVVNLAVAIDYDNLDSQPPHNELTNSRNSYITKPNTPKPTPTEPKAFQHGENVSHMTTIPPPPPHLINKYEASYYQWNHSNGYAELGKIDSKRDKPEELYIDPAVPMWLAKATRWVFKQYTCLMYTGIFLSALDWFILSNSLPFLLFLLIVFWRVTNMDQVWSQIFVWSCSMTSMYRIFLFIRERVSYVVIRHIKLNCSILQDLDTLDKHAFMQEGPVP